MYTQGDKIAAKFQSRTDITAAKRMLIAYLVLYQYRWGLISDLGHKYRVSRQFIYNVASAYKSIWAPCCPIDPIVACPKMPSVDFALLLRLEGKSSIESISTILTYHNCEHCSVGFVSQKLQELGRRIGNNLDRSVLPLRFVFCSDEIFAKQNPILITVDPVSLMILSIELSENRKAESWVSHWEHIIAQGYVPLYMVKDEGLGMKSAHQEAFADTAPQSDTFHAVSHRLGWWRDKLEKAAYSSISTEYDCERLLLSAKSEQTIQSRKKNFNWLNQRLIKPSNYMNILSFYINVYCLVFNYLTIMVD
jgi:hypothetical protein